jgi:EF hand domain-containing protein
MRQHLAWVVMMVLAASPSLAEDGKAKVPGKKGPAGLGPLSPEMMQQLLKKYDLNKDGQLSAEERAKAQEEMLGNLGEAGGAKFKEFLKKFDLDGDGQLNAREQAAAKEAMDKLRAQGGGPQVGAPVIVGANNEN